VTVTAREHLNSVIDLACELGKLDPSALEEVFDYIQEADDVD
jgi:hypothetical protein